MIQQAIRQIIEPIIDPNFMDNSHGFRLGKGTHSALKQCVQYYEEGTFEEIILQINRVPRGWINYFGLGFIKSFIKEIEGWLHHRIRQLILKRWKKPRTVIKKLKSYGLDLDSTKRIAFSRKKYWRLSGTPEVHWAITTKRLHQWGLVPLSELVELAYARF